MLKSSNEAKEIEILPSRGFYFSCQRPVKEMSAVSSILKTYSEFFFFETPNTKLNTSTFHVHI